MITESFPCYLFPASRLPYPFFYFSCYLLSFSVSFLIFLPSPVSRLLSYLSPVSRLPSPFLSFSCFPSPVSFFLSYSYNHRSQLLNAHIFIERSSLSVHMIANIFVIFSWFLIKFIHVHYLSPTPIILNARHNT